MALPIAEHFRPALQALDLRIHREILRLRVSYQLSLDEFRGLYISDGQVDAIINKDANERGANPGIEEINRRIKSQDEIAGRNLQENANWRKLSECYSLSLPEQNVVIQALAPELDLKYETLYAYLNNDVLRKYPCIDLSTRLSQGEDGELCESLFSEQGCLLGRGIICDIDQVNTVYHLKKGFALSPIVREFLLGQGLQVPAVDNLLKPLSRRSLGRADNKRDGAGPRPSAPAAELEEFSRYSLPSLNSDTGRFLLLADKHSAAELLLQKMFSRRVSTVAEIDLSGLLLNGDKIKKPIQQILQHALLSDAALVLNLHSCQLVESEVHISMCKKILDALFSSNLHFSIISPDKGWLYNLVSVYGFRRIFLQRPDAQERRDMWANALSSRGIEVAARQVDAVAEFFNLDYQQICASADQLSLQGMDKLQQNAGGEKPLFKVARDQSYSEIASLATKVENAFSFKDLILPREILGRIQEITAATHNRKRVFEDWGFGSRVGSARGILALFSGSSGTGKTMSASVIANEIGLDLYRVDLSRIVSKYIGETEKNLDKIFNAAKQANCILFFDEADALLGKRSEVKDAHDRYANVEVAYLLQKMEEHDGVVILTTNLAKNIDQAFTRRLQYIIEFPRPDEHHRELIWQSMFSEKSPLHDDVDFNFLARQFTNTGGDIKNIVLDAAMLAADSEEQYIDMPLLIRASARQLVKQGKVPSATEFKHFFELISSTG